MIIIEFRRVILLSDDVSTLNDQNMELTVWHKGEPISDNEAESSSSELKKYLFCVQFAANLLHEKTI